MTCHLSPTIIKNLKGMKQKCFIKIYYETKCIYEVNAEKRPLGKNIHTEEYLLEKIPENILMDATSMIIASTQSICINRSDGKLSCMNHILKLCSQYKQINVIILYCKFYWQDTKWYLKIRSGNDKDSHNEISNLITIAKKSSSCDQFITNYMINSINLLDIKNISIFHIIKNRYKKIL